MALPAPTRDSEAVMQIRNSAPGSEDRTLGIRSHAGFSASPSASSISSHLNIWRDRFRVRFRDSEPHFSPEPSPSPPPVRPASPRISLDHKTASSTHIPIKSEEETMLNGNRQAVVQLDFLIVGGGRSLIIAGGLQSHTHASPSRRAGIAGLATAYALAASGHRVRVLEQLCGPGQHAGGVRIPPNVTKILLEWGLEEELTKRASKVRPTNLEDFETGEIIGYLEWQEDVMKESGAPFLMMHHQDLYEALYKLALSAGAKVLFNSTVEAITPPPEAPSRSPSPTEPPAMAGLQLGEGSISVQQPPASKAPAAEYATPRAQVTLTNGQVLEADVIVGADGPHSFVRKFVEEEEVEERWSGMNVYSGTLSMSEMQSHPLLKEVLDLGWPMWMGDSRSVMGYRIRNDTEYAVHAWWTEEEPEESEGWDLAIPASHLLKYGNIEPRAQLTPPFHHRLRTLFERTKTFSRQRLLERPAPEDWVDGSERLVLVGEAAHPLMPCGTHGCSLAVEDAAVLGTLFSHLRSPDQIATLLYAYQDLRQERSGILNELELSNAGLCWFAPGPERDARNESMRQSRAQGSEHWDDSALGDQWGVISEVWGYHAVDAAEDWWVQWGLLRERAAFGT
ncbi:hypothetical protein EVG20_g8838, partial [Dentipellis fragilis]